MEEKYGMMDLITNYMNQSPIFPTISQPQTQQTHDDYLHYAMVMLGGGGNGEISFGSDHTTVMGMGSTTSGFSGDSGGGGGGLDMEINGGGRWPREETLILLDIRSRLNSKFKEATHKGPLWDEVSRIMSMEHGYKRTGKKCSEKFENLYKYYKKIKEGKAGRQDKKHYRFFRQLDAIYSEKITTTNPNPNPPLVTNNPSLLLDPQSCELSPFIEDIDRVEKANNKRRLGKKKHWKTMITSFIETKMNTLIEKQDAWMQKMMNTIDEKEKERISKEERWRKEEGARLETKKKYLSNERARMESRDSAIMSALQKLTTNESTLKDFESRVYSSDHNQIESGWDENEITQLMKVRSSMETRFEQGGCLEEVLWEEIALTMSCLGYNRNGLIYKAKWDHLNFLLRTKKRKENTTRSCSNLDLDQDNYIFANHQAISERNVALMNDHELMWNCYMR
ncbi:trihelix transcription factor PTL-like [Rutidosis leptorrhynchoides]|uniref:trihelix transcription factor PTL-like n=1 Tax=Rutidosis leptorrhynchoides TaxID=125765 RepID=UPI003A9A17B8